MIIQNGNTKGLGCASPLLLSWDLLLCSWLFHIVNVLRKRQSSGLTFIFCWFFFSLMKSSDIDQDLFTDSYCKVCSAQLISESQRVAHYEVRTVFPTQCFQMEERVAWVVVVGLEASPFCSWEDFKNHRACTFVVWAQVRAIWGCGVGSEAGEIILSPWLLPRLCLFFFLCTLAPQDSVGFLFLLNLSLLIPEVLCRDTRQDALVPASLFFNDPEDKLEALCSSLQGNMATSWLSPKLLPPGGYCPKCVYQLKDFPCRVITKF